MLQKIFKELDQEILEINKRKRERGSPELKTFFIKVLGQNALIEAKVELNLLATIDLDAYSNFEYDAKEAFASILEKNGLEFDELSNEIWMPKETKYTHVFKGINFDGFVADPDFVLISKAIKSPIKNRNILKEYIAGKPSKIFLELAEKYNFDWESIL